MDSEKEIKTTSLEMEEKLKVLNVIAKERLLSPQLVIEAIGTGKAEINLAHIRSYIMSELKKEQEVIANDHELTNKYRTDTDALKKKLNSLKSGPILIQGSRCAACNHNLELPSLHFLCQHSYHQHCFQSYSENENECLACHVENKKITELLKAREYTKDLNESFHSQLDKAPDAFSLAAEYFGRGVFNTVKVITDKPVEKVKSNERFKAEGPAKQALVYGMGAEARIRQEENKRSVSSIIPMSEGRLRVQENRISKSITEQTSLGRSVESTRSFKKPENTSKGLNPFDEDDDAADSVTDEDANNPFYGDDDADDEDDAYDKNLNPF